MGGGTCEEGKPIASGCSGAGGLWWECPSGARGYNHHQPDRPNFKEVIALW